MCQLGAWLLALDADAQVEYLSLMSNTTLTLGTLTFEELECLWCDCQVSSNFDFQDRLLAEMLTREDACPESYDLLWEMQDAGWGGDVTQDARDAR